MEIALNFAIIYFKKNDTRDSSRIRGHLQVTKNNCEKVQLFFIIISKFTRGKRIPLPRFRLLAESRYGLREHGKGEPGV